MHCYDPYRAILYTVIHKRHNISIAAKRYALATRQFDGVYRWFIHPRMLQNRRRDEYKFVNAHSGQSNPKLRRKRKALSGLEDLEIVGLEVMAEGVRAAVHIRRAGG